MAKTFSGKDPTRTHLPLTRSSHRTGAPADHRDGLKGPRDESIAPLEIRQSAASTHCATHTQSARCALPDRGRWGIGLRVRMAQSGPIWRQPV